MMPASQWWDPRTLLDCPGVPVTVKAQLAGAAVLGADPDERDGWRQAAERAGVPVDGVGSGGTDPVREYHDALAVARSAAESAQAYTELAHASGMTVDAMLDLGSAGLRYFEEFLPLAAALAPQTLEPATLDYPGMRRRYDEQRGMNIAALESDAEQIRVQSRIAGEELDLQRDQLRSLREEQSGTTVDAAEAFLRDQLARAGRDLEHLLSCGDALSAAAHTLGSVVRDKAEMTAGLYSGEVAGRTVGQIAVMVELVCGTGTPDHAAAAAVTRWQPAVPGVSAVAPVVAVRAACERWLREVFLPAVQSRCDAFIELCDRTDTAVTQTFRALTALLDETDDGAYPRPDGATLPSEPASTDIGGPLTPAPAHQPGGAEPTAIAMAPEPFAAPAWVASQPPAPAYLQAPADWRAVAPNALPGSISAGVAGVPGLSALVGDFGGQVERATVAVGEALHEVGKALHETLAIPVVPPIPVVMGDFQVALEVTPASMSLQVTGLDGQVHDYAVTIGSDGVPQLTVIESGTNDAAPQLDVETLPVGTFDEGPLDMPDRSTSQLAEPLPAEPLPAEPLPAEPLPADRQQPVESVSNVETAPLTILTPPAPDDIGAQLAESWE